MPTTTASRSELDILQDLNRDYIRSVQHSDVRRFDEILADDFLCSNPDGSLIDRAAFLKQTAAPVAISNLEARGRRRSASWATWPSSTRGPPICVRTEQRAPAGTRTCGPVTGAAGSPSPLTSRAADAPRARSRARPARRARPRYLATNEGMTSLPSQASCSSITHPPG